MPIQNPWKTQIIELINRGLDLIHPVDQVDSEHFSRLTNVESVLEGDIRSRLGTSLVSAAAISGAGGAGSFEPPTQGDIKGTDANAWVQVTSSTADAYGSWTEMIASTDYAGTWVTISVVSNQAAVGLDNRFDVAIGSGGSEVAFITEMTYRFQRSGANGGTQQMDISFPFTIPSGSRIAIRNKDDDGSTRVTNFLVNILG